MYERTARSTHKAASTVLSHAKPSQADSHEINPAEPGAHILALCGKFGADLLTAELHGSGNHEETTIQDIAGNHLGLRFVTVSDRFFVLRLLVL